MMILFCKRTGDEVLSTVVDGTTVTQYAYNAAVSKKAVCKIYQTVESDGVEIDITEQAICIAKYEFDMSVIDQLITLKDVDDTDRLDPSFGIYDRMM